MKRSDDRINLKISSDALPRLEVLAEQFGLFWGDKPSVNALVNSLGKGDLEVALPQPPLPEYAIEIKELVAQQSPFTIAYPDKVTGELKQYPILYAEMVRSAGDVTRIDHDYLECYCAVANELSEIPELAHNRTFRLDKLQGVVASPLTNSDYQWRQEGLATVDVRLRLFGGLAHNYELSKTQIWGASDISSEKEWIDATTCEIVWRVTSYLWFKRLVMRYGASCAVMEPLSIRNAIAREIAEMARNYSANS